MQDSLFHWNVIKSGAYELKYESAITLATFYYIAFGARVEVINIGS